jgi:hypothetical protein
MGRLSTECAPTSARPTQCWHASLTPSRPSTRRGGWLSFRRWTCLELCCSRSWANSYPWPPRAEPWVASVLFGGRLPSPAELLEVPKESLRQAGLSWRKVATLRDLAEHLSDGRLDPNILSKMADDEVVAALTAIPGIGPWTAQGTLILALQREDVVLPGDLALRKALQRAYGLDHLPSQAEVLAVAEKWRPYRSVATSYLFSSAFDGPDLPSAAAGTTGGPARRR